MNKPFLFITAGFPGTGKSTLSKALAEKLNLTHLIGDKIRADLTNGKPTHSKEETLEMIATLDRAAVMNLQMGKGVICDVNYLKQSDRKRYYEIASNHNAVPVTLWFDCSLELALERNKQRSPETDAYYNNTPDETVIGMYKRREGLANYENGVVIDCSLPVAKEVQNVIVSLSQYIECT